MSRSLFFTLAVLIACSACGDENAPPDRPTPLVDHRFWTVIDPTEDPLGHHAPLPVDCPPGAWRIETEGDPLLEVDTSACNYFGGAQPALEGVCEGCKITLTLWNLGLFDLVPGEAHAALSIDGHVVWQVRVPIPSDARVWTETVTSTFTAAKNAPIVFHLHNHGTNSWRFNRLDIVAP